MLKIQNQNTITVQDWDTLVRNTYGKPYKFQQQYGCQPRGIFEIIVPNDTEDFENYTVPEVVNGKEKGVKFEAWLARNPKEWNNPEQNSWTLDLFWHRNFYPDIQMVANDLHAKGLLPAGEYFIKIDW